MIEPSNTDFEAYTKSIEHEIKLSEALERLENNPDFKLVIIDGYLNSKALDSVSLLARPEIKKRGERADIMEDLVAISNFQYYLWMIKELGGVAKQNLTEVNSTVE